MPLGEVFAEVTAKVTSVKYSDHGVGQTKIEVNVAGEVKGTVTGHTGGTFTVIRTGNDMTRAAPWTYIGRVLLASGHIASVTGQGLVIGTGQGHKIRFRGSMCGTNDDPKLSQLNSMISAFEAEADPIAGTLTGANCFWR